MVAHQLSKQIVADVNGDLARLGATCRLATKSKPRGSWQTVHQAIATFDAALDLVAEYSKSACEVAVFLEHEQYGGIMIWSTSEPDIANRLSDYKL
jgi:hypothetical protein